MTILRRILAFVAALLAPLTSAAQITVFEAREIVTMEPALPRARFVAVRDGRILGVGARQDDLAAWLQGDDWSLDRRYAEHVIVPGFVEPHLHPMQAAVMLPVAFIAPDDWDLPSGPSPGVRDPAGYRDRLRAAIRSDGQEGPFLTWGYHELWHGPLDRAALDALAPDRPVIVWQRSFHDMIVNSPALRLMQLGDRAAFAAALAALGADPAHGDFERGYFSETALAAALRPLRPHLLDPDRLERGFADLLTILRHAGVTMVADMATGIFADFDTEAGLIAKHLGAPGTPVRTLLVPIAARWMDVAEDQEALASRLAGAQAKFAGARVLLGRRVKLFADGAFFAQGMRMAAPGYTDGHQGKWLTEPAELTRQAEAFWKAGWSIHTHVNGDEGLDVVLGIVERLLAIGPRPTQTHTLEHLGYSTEAQNRRIARLGLSVSAQPNYIRVLGDKYGEVGLGVDRAAQMSRLGSLESKGVPLGLHSDFNMAPIDPLYLAWVASNRVTMDGHSKAPAERLSLDKALRAVTIEAAEVIGLDAEIGSIAAGKRADFAVLDDDPYRVGATGLRDLRVVGIVFAGEAY
jgi:predicted amidohydrolase YtcJ